MRFIWGHALVNVFITGQRILGWSIYFSCACQRGPSRGWSVRRILLPYVYTCLLEYMTYNDWVVYTYKVYSNTLDICLVWIRICIWYGHSFEGSVPILRVLSSLNVSDVFRGGFKLVRPFFWSFLHTLDCLSLPILSGVYNIVPRSSTIWPSSGGASVGSCFLPQLRMTTGAPKVLEGLLCSVPRNMLPALFFPCLMAEKVLTGCFPYLRQDFWFSRISSCFMRKERIK